MNQFIMTNRRRTKIVATVGPACQDPEVIRELIEAGVDVFRLNFSHGSLDQHRRNVESIRAAESEVEHAIGILQDLQGPKIRLAKFADPNGIELSAGDIFRLTTDDSPGNSNRCGTTLPDLITELEPEQRLLLNDGLVVLRVLACEREALVCRVEVGGPLSDHKGINVPDADLSVPALSEKDREDLAFGVELGVDWVALSFVRTADDLRQARDAMAEAGSTSQLMAKIEKPGAVARFDELLALVDGVMIARGDLGVELPPEDVPVIQKRLIAACIDAGKPVVVATQMLESMIQNPRPTRAEASDVANAMFELADAVMLSGETAIGQHPVAAVKMMDRVAREVEASPEFAASLHRFYPQPNPGVADAVSHSACRIAEILPASAIASFTWTGSTARRVSRHRPAATIVGLTPFESVARKLALGWGIVPLTAPDPTSSDTMCDQALAQLKEAGLLSIGDKVVVTAGVPFGRSGTTNMLRVEEVDGDDLA